MKKICICICMLLMFATVIPSSITFAVGNENNYDQVSVTYSFEKPVVKKVKMGETNYDQIVLHGTSCNGNPGEPSLPARGAYLLLPQETDVGRISVTVGKRICLGSGYNIIPVGEPIPLSEMNSYYSPVPDEMIYRSEDIFPGELFITVGTYGFRGYEILVLSLHPVEYIPSNGKLFYYTEMTVSVELTKVENINMLFRGLEQDKQEMIRKVDNPVVAETYTTMTRANSLGYDYDILILTTDELKDGFEPLKDAHNDDGSNTIIKTLTDVGGSTPKDIRDYIRDAYLNWSIEYVLIGGDDDIIPARGLYVWGSIYVEYNMPSDVYYACLDGTYNYDGDDKWGERTDGDNGKDVDLVAEVYVGRACVGNNVEVNHFVNKTISHMNIDFDDSYLKDVLMAGEYLGFGGISQWGGNLMDEMINGSCAHGYTTVGIPSNEYNITTLYDRDWHGNKWPKSEIIDCINNGIHFVNHIGHGTPTSAMKMYNSDANNLINDKFCFVYSQTCSAGHFDGLDCFAEHMNVKTEHGAYAVIMNARYGWGLRYSTDGPSQRFHREFWDAVFGEDISVIGRANHDSKEDNLWRINQGCMRWCYYELNLFGDPSLYINNPPPKRPEQPDGPNDGATGVEYTFSTITIDSEGENVSYLWEWGDGTPSKWQGPFDSGVTVYTNHTWLEAEDYNITVKAKDVYDAESDWSDPLAIHIVDMPILEIGNITIRLSKVSIVIKNNGSADATGVDWSITLDGGFIIMGKKTAGRVLNILIGEEVTVNSKLIIGFGKTMATVTAEKPGVSSDTKEQDAFMFLFIKI